MPILERDPWRFQFFTGHDCPEDVVIPTDDPDSWQLYPRHRWVYDKLKIAESQKLRSAPHGVTPDRFPVFSKPMINLKGMGVGSRAILSRAEFEQFYEPGHFWMELLEGPHVSTDCAVCHGDILWMRHCTGVSGDGGTFRHWTIEAATKPALEDYLANWVGRHLRTYCGMLNFETIGGRIIEAHLRFADQWCDLYGEGWVEALIGLYAKGAWDFDDRNRRDGYSVPLFATHGEGFRHPPMALQQQIRAMPGVKSLQISFHEGKDPEHHAMPPGGFRIGIVNATCLEAGLEARRMLASAFPPERMLLPPETEMRRTA
ncbi:hypothetical protein [Aestuariivirga sp.]|uniref:hypothetical protein n=1 Tax=Aestuariivirga sp. TaxID=2650926 RepID=UPI0039E4776B